MEKMTDLLRADVRITGGFWGNRIETARKAGLMAVYDRFADTGRFGALDFHWREGMPKPHIFWDSDIAKWIEAAAYLLMDARDPEIEKLVDDAVDKIEAHQRPDGYFNIYFDSCEPEARFTRYTDHELYDLGHLIEAAIAYRDATGKDKLLQLMIRYADLVDRVFRVEGAAGFDTPGHPELELALFKLYRATGDEKWLALMRHFIDTRGTSHRDKTYDVFGKNSYSQAHLPVREQFTAEGHSVRACYLYAGMADLAWQDEDAGLRLACEKLFSNIVERRMYATGGIGSSHVGEAFTIDYDLMNRTAYAETCAALSLALFARRMSRMEPRALYADVAELSLYNGMLAGISLDGTRFFYENPLEVHPDIIHFNEYYDKARDHMPITRRVKVFDCSCCPPNVLRIIGSVGDFAFTQGPSALYVHHYMDCAADTRFGSLSMRTGYPFDGKIEISPPAGAYSIALRIPGWAKDWTLAVNGAPAEHSLREGYAYLNRAWAAGDALTLNLALHVRLVAAHPALHEDCGRVAVMRGPIVYCLEEQDNGKYLKDIKLARGGAPTVSTDAALNVPVIDLPASRRSWPDSAPLYMDFSESVRLPMTARFIPYFAWANRDEGEMLVWTDVD
jgi:DUF1680 family protein